jgi:lipopolysaccharide transport system permease protein
MSSVTVDPSITAKLSAPAAPIAIVRIEPAHAWLELRLREVWMYRELLYFFVWRDLKVRYKQTAVGVAWVVLQPLLSMGAFTLFFGKLAKLPSDGLPYPVFYFAALAPWTYFSTALMKTTGIVVVSQNLITKVYFPRLILPISGVVSGLVDFAIAFAELLVLVLQYGLRPGMSAIFWLPFLVLLAVATALGVGLWLAALNALYRDVGHVLPFLVQFWMLASPVAYPSSMVPAKWRWLYGLNPMAGVIEGFRWALTGHGQPPGALLLASSCAVLVLLVGGAMFFQRMEGTIADLV